MNVIKEARKELEYLKRALKISLISNDLTEKELDKRLKRIEDLYYFIARFEVETHYIKRTCIA